MGTTVPGHEVLDHEAYTNLISEVVSLRIGSLLLPLPSRSKKLQEHYAHWIEQTLLQQLWPANTNRIRAALASAREAINDLDIDRTAYGNLF